MVEKRIEKINRLKELCYSLYLVYNTDDYKEAIFSFAELNIELADLRFKFRKNEARRKQQERLYIDKYKDDDLYKSDAKCKAKFESDNTYKMFKFRILRWEVEHFEWILESYRIELEWLKSAEIDRKHENKMNNTLPNNIWAWKQTYRDVEI